MFFPDCASFGARSRLRLDIMHKHERRFAGLLRDEWAEVRLELTRSPIKLSPSAISWTPRRCVTSYADVTPMLRHFPQKDADVTLLRIRSRLFSRTRRRTQL